MYVIDWAGAALRLLIHRGRPWVAIAPLCQAIGATASRQLARLKRRPEFRLREIGGEPCIPLLNVSAFLVSCRTGHRDLALFRARCAEELEKGYLRAMSPASASSGGGYSPELLAALAADYLRRRRSKVDQYTLAEIRRLIGEGYTQASIARALKLSKGTISQLVNGRYPARAVSPKMSGTTQNQNAGLEPDKLNALERAEVAEGLPADEALLGLPTQSDTRH